MKGSLEDKIRDAMAFKDRLSLSPSQVSRTKPVLVPRQPEAIFPQSGTPAPANPPTPGVRIDPAVQMSSERLYNNAKLQQEKLETLRQKREKELTFTPELISSRNKRDATLSQGERFETLYQDSLQRRKKIEEEQEKAKLNKECTFTPRTTDLPRSLRKKWVNRPPSPGRSGDRLYANAKIMELKKKLLREQMEQKENLTFKPEITEKAKRASSGDAMARAHSLYASHKDQAKKIEEKSKEYELKGCTFKPKINRQPVTEKGATPEPATVQERLLQYGSKVEKKRQQRRKELEDQRNQECTFVPKIASLAANTASTLSSDAEIKPPSGEIHDRLYREAQDREQRKTMLAHEHDKASGITFAPNITNEPKRKVDPAVFDRLSAPSRRAAQEEEMLKTREQQELKHCTFAPNISSAPNRLKRRESGEKVWNRLHKERDGVEQERTRTRRRSEVKDCTFAPKVNKPRKNSVTTANSKTDQEYWKRLSGDDRRAQKIKDLKRSIEEKERASCTFKPKLYARPPSPRLRESKQSIFERLSCTKELDKKKKQREEERQARELEECTFAPKISESPRVLKKPSVESIVEQVPKIALESKQQPRNNVPKKGFLQRLEDQATSESKCEEDAQALQEGTEKPTIPS